jgi:hypothetical protein
MVRTFALYTMTLASCLPALPVGAGEQEDVRARAIELVEHLGSPSFSQRTRAMNRLLQLGPAAIAPLEEASRSRNREVRFRSQRLLESVRELEFERQLEAFIQLDDDSPISLPGWTRFRDRYGNEGDTRQLFVAMQRAEREMLRQVDGGPDGLASLIHQRVESLQQARRFQGADMSIGTILALLFTGSDPAVSLSDTAVKTIFGVCGYSAFSEEMYRQGTNDRRYIRHDPRSDVIRAMFADWMQRPGAHVHYQGFLLCLNYDIEESTVTALRAIEQKDSSPHVKQYALRVLAAFGGGDHIGPVSKLLDDNTFCAGTQRINDVQYRTQIRDVVLVCLLSIEKLNPQKYGFPRFTPGTRLFQLSEIGFPSDEEREEAHAKWRVYVAAKETETE